MVYSGWDIGGAHIKVARADASGKLISSVQFPCPLWKGIQYLITTIEIAVNQLKNKDDHHFITMTGELVDAFENRQQGVEAIINCVSEHLSEHCKIYAGDRNFLTPEQAKKDWSAVASMNWQASATYSSEQIEHGLFIDIGSTTCDIIPIIKHQIAPAGFTDYQRQLNDELVYTGTIRTPLAAVTQHAPVNGNYISLSAEWFATMGDVWRILGFIEEHSIQDDSADGLSWSREACEKRLARMVGADANMLPSTEWLKVANWFAEKQLQRVTDACLRIMSSHADLSLNTPIIGAGVGKFIVEQCANRIGTQYIDFSTFTGGIVNSSENAPASALALLAKRDIT